MVNNIHQQDKAKYSIVSISYKGEGQGAPMFDYVFLCLIPLVLLLPKKSETWCDIALRKTEGGNFR